MLEGIKKYFSINDELDSFENIQETVIQGIRFKGTNLITLVFAIFIASLGLNINSTAVIIGAMLISPLMGPIIGIGFGASTYKLQLIKSAFKNYLFATIISICTSTFYFLISPIDDAQSELLARISPNIYDVLIALFGGFAGITAITVRNKGNVLSGVAIATALMPPLCTTGYGIATGQFSFAIGALYLYFINTVFIILSSYLYLKFINYPKNEINQNKQIINTNRIIFWVSMITMLPSIYFGYDLIKKNSFDRNANKYINNEFNFPNSLVLKRAILYNKNKIQLFIGGVKIDSTILIELVDRKSKYNLNNALIEINQGATFDNSNYSNINSNEKNIEMLNLLLSNLMDSVRSSEEEYNNISKEIKFLVPNIDTSYLINNSLFTKDSSNKTLTVILDFNESSSNSFFDSAKLVNWLKLRLQRDSVTIKIIK